MNYPGGKNRVYQTIINQTPPHETYIEPFLGSGAVMRMKRPARMNIGLDLDNEQLQLTRSCIVKPDGTSWLFFNRCAIDWLQQGNPTETEMIYLDPPYLMSTRRSPRPLYRHELTSSDHERLLTIIRDIDGYVAISGYWSEMYADMLADWRYISFETMTRGGGRATEYLWMNYPEPTELHDYRHLGDDYRERERIKRKKQRWVRKLQGMDILERKAVLWAIQEHSPLSPETTMLDNTATSDGASVPPEMTM